MEILLSLLWVLISLRFPLQNEPVPPFRLGSLSKRRGRGNSPLPRQASKLILDSPFLFLDWQLIWFWSYRK